MAKKLPASDVTKIVDDEKTISSTELAVQGERVVFPCLSFEQGGHRLAYFTASAKQLWKLLEINRREENKDVGYQRALSLPRVERIAKFVDAGDILPTSLLVSFDDATLSPDGTQLSVPNKEDAGWVIDGQHRLAGGHKATKDVILPVVAFTQLALEHQIKCFVTINKEQKGVSSSLYYELLRHLPGNKSEADVLKERAADLALSLKSDEGSPFYNRIKTTIAPKHGELSLTNFVRKVSPLLKRNTGRLSSFSDDERRGILNNFYRALQEVFPTEYRRADTIFFKTVGFGALLNALPTCLDLALQHEQGFRVADIILLFKRVETFSFDSWHVMGSGNSAELTAGNELRTRLQEAYSNTGGTGLRLN